MKFFFKNITLFILFIIPFYVLLLIFFGENMPSFINRNLGYKKGGIGFMDERIKDIVDHKNIDILFIGSSHAYRGYDPRFYKTKGIKSFNLGSSAQTPKETLYLLEKYFDILNPKLIIVDIYPFLMRTEGVESALNIISNSDVYNDNIFFLMQYKNINVLNTLIFNYYKNYIRPDKVVTKDKKNQSDLYIRGGFVESYDIYNPEMNSTFKKQDILYKQSQIESLVGIQEFLNEKKQVKYLFVQTPITKKKYESFNNNDVIDSIINNITAEKYINLNNKIKLDDSLFMDDNHLNQIGVEVFNEYFFNVLEQQSYINFFQKEEK